MLQNIQIQNFRCFENFNAEGFERINLIGGKNNSGKTCLLEAILCLNKEALSGSEAVYALRNQDFKDLLNEKYSEGTVIISTQVDTINYEATLIINTNSYGSSSDFIAPVFYITTNKICPYYSFEKGFNSIETDGKEDLYLNIFNIADNGNTSKARTIGNSGTTPRIKQNNKTGFLSIKSQGDAIKSLYRYFTPILERYTKGFDTNIPLILLIDEIENGIHYSVHYDFWKTIFKLSKELNVQIFATTHSLEMIQQFNKVAKEEGEAAYFEMFRDSENGKIVAAKHDTALLEYELETHENFRGEPI